MWDIPALSKLNFVFSSTLREPLTIMMYVGLSKSGGRLAANNTSEIVGCDSS